MYDERESRREPFVGRTQELALLTEALARAGEGVGASVVVEGEAGIGKTRLVDEAIRTSSGLHVLRTSCGELEQEIPFAGIAAALAADRSSSRDVELSTLRELIAGSSDGADVRFRIVEEILHILEKRALAKPVVVILDDVHRADPGTLLVSKRLVDSTAVLPVTLLATSRSYPRPPGVSEALAGATRITLSGLVADDVSDFAAKVLGAEPRGDLLRALEACGGNPLYTSELLAALRNDDRIEVVGRFADLIPGALPVSLRLTIIGQLSSMSDQTARMLRVAACLGSPFDVLDLARVVEREPDRLYADLEGPLREGLLADTEVGIAFRHDLVREAIYEDIPQSVRAAFHAQIARVLRSLDRPALQIVPHLLRSTADGDDSSVDVMREAAREALPRSARAAVELLEHASERAPEGYVEQEELNLELASALSAAGRQAEAEALARRVLAGGDNAANGERARGVLAQALLAGDRAHEALEVIETMARAEGLPGRERAHLLAQGARVWARTDHASRARIMGSEALSLAENLGDDGARCEALLALAWTAGIEGDPAWLEHIASAADIVRRGAADHSTSADVAWLYLFIFGVLLPLRDDARALANAQLRRADSSGHLWALSMLHDMLSFDHLRWGELDDADSGARTAIEFAQDLGSHRFLSWSYGTLARVAVYRDDLDLAQRWLAAADAYIAREDLPWAAAFRVFPAKVEFHEARGEQGRALETLLEAYTGFRPRRGLLLSAAPYTPKLVRYLLDAGRTDEARDVLEAFDALGDEMQNKEHRPGLWAFLQQSRALFEADPALAYDSLAAHREMRWGFFALPLALDDAARVLTLRGRSDDAIPLLQEALGLWQHVGAPAHVARLTARLRELGVRRGVRGRRGRPSTGWEALTETELRVARLVAEGLTYREVAERMFLSRRTVEGHVARIFTKLGLGSRRELAAEVAGRDAQ